MLTKEQARENLKKYGYNELVEGKRKSVLQIFLEQFKDFLVMILMISAVVSCVLGETESGAVIFAVITLNALLGTVQTVKAEQSLNSLKMLSAPEAKVIREGELCKIPAREVTIGDEVVIEAGDYIAADGKLIECNSLQVDESVLTGESLPVHKSLKEIPEDAAIGDQVNRVFSGCYATYGRGAFMVEKVGMYTEMGKIANLLNRAEDKKTPLQKNLDDFGRKLSIIIMVICGGIFFINVLKGGDIVQAFLFAVALAVAAIPEALSSIVTIVLAFGTQKMAKEHAIIRKLQAVEGLGSVSVICSDKTGTLTQNKMTVEYYFTDGKQIKADEIVLEETNQKKLLMESILCNDATVNAKECIGDPTETALVDVAHRLHIDVENVRETCKRLREIPFDSDRKLMSTCHLYDGRQIMVTKGACDVLTKRVDFIDHGGKINKITEQDIVNIEKQNDEFSRNGLRVLAFAYKNITEQEEMKEEHLTFLGLIAMMDPPRVESKAAVEACIKAGIKPIMITGDHKVTATAIARRIGILKEESEACEGSVIENMSDQELENYVDRISVYARVSPEHKIRIVHAWQKKGNIVAMTGDGVNDAPALKQADIGVAMGITGSEVSKDAASMVLTDDNFATIVKAVENGRNVYQNIKNSIQFLLSGNLGAILAVLYAAIVSLPVPFAPVHLLFINLLTDSLPAIALGLEPHNADVMKEKPRALDESILTKRYLVDIGLEGLIIGIFSMAAFYIGYQDGNAKLASTMAFGTLCLGRLFHGFSSKSKKPLLLKARMFDNKYLNGAFLLGALLISGVITIPFLQGIFQVAVLRVSQLFIVYGLSILSFIMIQIMKLIRRK